MGYSPLLGGNTDSAKKDKRSRNPALLYIYRARHNIKRKRQRLEARLRREGYNSIEEFRRSMNAQKD